MKKKITYLQYTCEQGMHLLHSKRSALHIMQLKGPILKLSESYPRGHFGEIVADSVDSGLELASHPGCCLFALCFFKDPSSGRATFAKGQTGFILVNTL